MRKLPEKFPEYSIMYRTIAEQIKNLEVYRQDASEEKIASIDSKIKKYQEELDKIKNMFPEGYFEK